MWAHLPSTPGALHSDRHHRRKLFGRWAIQNSHQHIAFAVSEWCTRCTPEEEFQGQPYVSSHLLLGGACKGPCGCRRSLRNWGKHAGSLTPAVGHAILRDPRQAKDTGINFSLGRSKHSGKADTTASALRVTSGLGGSLPCNSPGNGFPFVRSFISTSLICGVCNILQSPVLSSDEGQNELRTHLPLLDASGAQQAHIPCRM